ncbi:MAG TPA: SGNH/GDSL hydrolase family protein [Verrucomicrobiota bacterium]|nr:SGNH/GDSL hydrolase family protein [Verrucomicrobiota bacterium]HNU50045.1 SGNH/GDSL hydrolase family protein [Verrucomicrobiota bacterium]
MFAWMATRPLAANSFEAEIQAFEAADRQSPPPPNSVLFVGSSSIRMWSSLAGDFPGFLVLNRGFGGSQASDVLYFHDRVVTPYRPPLIVYYEGDNDLVSGKTPAVVFADWTNFVGRVERDLPGTGIAFLAVKPSPSRVAYLGPQRTLNTMVQEYCRDRPLLRFVDVFTPMLNDSGQPRPELFGSDMLHMNAAGYALWRSLVEPVLEAWALEHPVPSIRKPARTVLLDFGGSTYPSLAGAEGETAHWNNVLAEVAGTPGGRLADLGSTNGGSSGIGLRMIVPFTDLTEEGAVESTAFPSTASRDGWLGGGDGRVPLFRLSGLARGLACTLTFYASSPAMAGIRETRFTVRGARTAYADLEVSGNVHSTAVVAGIEPDAAGEITVALTPGPRHTDPDRRVALGVLRIDWAPAVASGILLDFGAAAATTAHGTSDPDRHWNNVTPAVGSSSTGRLEGLVTTGGLVTDVSLQMLSRFNGANENGATGASKYPASATRDSLFGNTETFSGLANATPVFELRGLDPARAYNLTFYASRLGASDNRQTRYTVTGARTAVVDLNAANNVDLSVTVTNLSPAPGGSLRIAITPGPANNNSYHFTYLGVLEIVALSAVPTPAASALTEPAVQDRQVTFRISGTVNATYWIQGATAFEAWEDLEPVTLGESERVVTRDLPENPWCFYRAVAW